MKTNTLGILTLFLSLSSTACIVNTETPEEEIGEAEASLHIHHKEMSHPIRSGNQVSYSTANGVKRYTTVTFKFNGEAPNYKGFEVSGYYGHSVVFELSPNHPSRDYYLDGGLDGRTLDYTVVDENKVRFFSIFD